MHLIDVVPTLLELAGATKPAAIKGHAVPPAPGRSLVPAFARDGAVPPAALWWLHENNRAIRVGDWKLVALAQGDWELYDLARDRGEETDLAARHPEKVRELAAAWQREFDAAKTLALTDPPPAAPAAAEKKAKKKQP